MARRPQAPAKPPRGFRPVVSTPETEKGAQKALSRRQRFEKANPARTKDILDQPAGGPGSKTLREAGVSHATAYRMNGYEDDARHPMGQQELPGMESVAHARESGLLSKTNTPAAQSRTLPDLAPAPRQWEDMHPDEQKKTLELARRVGATPKSMHQNFGAQLDQAHMRAAEHGAEPHAMRFYSGAPEGPTQRTTAYDNAEVKQPKDVLRESAKHNDVDFSTQVLANGITSPKSKFMHRNATTGEVSYPNDQAANVAIQGVKKGESPANLTIPKGTIGLKGNIRRAANAVQQRVTGTAMADVRNPGGSSPFGPKTGPYTNSWLDPHGSSQFFVSDIHSGGGGMVPHTDHRSPFKKDENGAFLLTSGGKRKKDSSERENYLAIPGIHALHDHVVRKVMSERGVQSLSGTQAAQWGEEQIGRASASTGKTRKQTIVQTRDTFATGKAEEHDPNQGTLFGGDSAPHPALGSQFGGK